MTTNNNAVGYSTIALNHVIHSKFDPKAHPSNRLDELLSKLKRRDSIILLKRLTIILDELSEKGFGLTQQNQAHFSGYDILALAPTTPASFSLACLTHTIPSPLTTHIITLPTDFPKQLRLKHTLVATAIKNGAMFEVCYNGALSMDEGVRRAWWGCAREAVRACSKGIVFSSGAEENLRAPRDIANLVTILGLAQDQALNTVSRNPKTIIIRAQTRKTYRAILSEPRIVYPTHLAAETSTSDVHQPQQTESQPDASAPISVVSTMVVQGKQPSQQPSPSPNVQTSNEESTTSPSKLIQSATSLASPFKPASPANSLKRTRQPSPTEGASGTGVPKKKKKKKKGGGGIGNPGQLH